MKILILSVLLFLSGWIQASHPVFSRITTDNGLSSAQISSVLQDRKGYLWIGTAEGLNRYDGDTFVVYRPDPEDKNSIQGSYIDQLFEDATGSIWIFFTSGEISMYDPATEHFTNYSKEWLQQQFRMYGKPTCFSASVPGRAFIGTENGLLMYTYSTGKLTHVQNTASVVSSTLVNCLYMSPDGLLWIGTLSGYSSYNPRKDTFTDYTLHTYGDSSTRPDNLNGVHCIYEDSSGGLWVGTGKKGAFRAPATVGERLFYPVGRNDTRIYRFLETRGGDIWFGHSRGATLIREGNRESLRYEQFFDSPADLAPSGECHVKTLLEDKNGIVWFSDSRFNRGQYYYDSHIRRMDVLLHSAENPYSISSNQITCLYMDRSDNLWIGHANYGLSRCDLNLPVFSYMFGYAGDNGSLSSNHVVAVYEDSHSNLWIGTTKGLDRLNQTTSRIDKRYQFSPAGGETSLSGQRIGSLAEDGEGNLWISYLDASPDRLNLESCRKLPLQMNYRQENEPAMKNTAKLCLEPSGDFAWLTTANAGVVKYEISSHKTYFYTHPSLPVQDRQDSYTDLLNVCLTPDQNIWIGTDGEGLRCLNKIADTFTNYKHASDHPGSIASDHIRYLFCDESGVLWIGTNAGLDRYNKSTGQFEHFTVRDGLAGNVIQGIQEAEPGILFVSTSRGISRLDTHTRQIINYTTANGLLSNEFIAGACCKRKSGEIVFGSNRGIVSFDPARIQEGNRKIAHSPLISDVYLGDKPLKNAPLSLPFQDLKDLKIQFLSFNYAYPGNNRYRYKLEPYDPDWKPTDSGHRYASYNELPPGSYTFLVEASEDGIVWSKPTVLPIRILPPWWRTTWFISLLLIGVVALLYLLYKSRIHWYKVRQAELEQKVHDRTILLKQANHKLQQLDEQKTRFFTHVSHELRTPLTIINGLTESLEQQPDFQSDEKKKDTLHTIRRNTTRLIRHVNELLDASMPDKGIPESPASSMQDMYLFFRELTSSFIPVAEKYNLSFSYSISPDIQMADFEPEALEQVIYNLVSNAFKYTPDGGSIWFTASVEQDISVSRLILQIQDTGIGIPSESLPYIFDPFYQDQGKTFQRSASSGIGLASVKELIEQLQGTLVCESQVGKGSLFTCSIPIVSEAYPIDWLPDSGLSTQSAPLSGIHTLLFIEDNEDLCRYMSDSFSADYQICLAKNGEEGFRIASETQPDAIISDVMMPVMDGISCCKKLKTDERTAHIPVILLTALSEEKRQLDGYGAGADDYLAKPFNIHILKAKIRNLIARKEQLQAYFKESFNLHTPSENIPDPDKAFVQKATEVVLDNLQNPQFDAEQFCSEMAMSRANLFRKLKASTGFSASSFTRNIRIKRAAELLLQRTHTINEISTLVGFSDPNYFSRCFKEIYGVTPSNY